MSLKRNLQFIKRKTLNIIKHGRFPDQYFLEQKEHLKVSVPKAFNTALFNFTIDFELIWGNGNVNQKEHSKERRIQSASSQAKNFKSFIEMLNQLQFPITWATLGKLADCKLVPQNGERFNPDWAQRDWYDEDYLLLPPELWEGKKYLNEIKNSLIKHEFMSHGYAHIDYSDNAVSIEVAKWDMQNGIETLRQSGLDINGFVFPCNHHKYDELLKGYDIKIIRGSNASWQIENELVKTPIGFWISPAFYTFKEIKELIDTAIENHSFIHPWMHLIECDLAQGDIENFYYPLFSYIKSMEDKNKIKNISFTEIEFEIRKANLSI